ncbi:glutamate-5-semialdehyde dehydrogenase [Parasphaerochaeta coccoides]|uniref:Gamma-glutamyl phosphate reductase n=1 Tax=Parasphaerochaeta coccoides (strain ATCC BAA-1237 / DSM 17374 / SPN1) TaxID=760011 RepID=F4GIL0_PARC1|nr:glutamate-5-semialdehyde dehydrogenase [Parasphaerochaeta coccoides]AEC02144.1 glutamate-5-semialdehyde dehydrogenase [Parasphaerochaeta coccoides DSM 17374]
MESNKENNHLTADIREAGRAARALSSSSAEKRNDLLRRIRDGLFADAHGIFEANRRDMSAAETEGETSSLMKRLVFDRCKLDAVQDGLVAVEALPDPIGTVEERRLLDDGLVLEKVRFPLGVIGMIFEARPDALVQIVSLCIKSGNGIVLKGGREALETNKALVASIRSSCASHPLGSGWMVHLESRGDVDFILGMDKDIDLLIPRGSNSFVQHVMSNTRIPVLGHADGICAIYVDKDADVTMAVRLAVDSKTQYPAACNSIETLLVHQAIAPVFLPEAAAALEGNGVKLKGDEATCRIIAVEKASPQDYDTEFISLTLAVKVVESYEEAVEHIAEHGSGHTDCIVTENEGLARRFMRDVDSSDVFWNCSTRFADGFRFGLGAEVGISTGKIHARGPVGLDGLVNGRWLLKGQGHVVSDYSGASPRKFKHQELPADSPSMAAEN